MNSDQSRERISRLGSGLFDDADGLGDIDSPDDDDESDLDVFDDDRQRTPIGATPIVLNPKVDGDATALCCPECGEEIAAESFKDGEVVEYRCGCDELQKFKVAGEDR